MITVDLWLYGKPSWDMNIEGAVKMNPDTLKIQADIIKERLYKIAEIVNILQNNGWYMAESYGAIYSLSYFKEGYDSIEDIEKELICLGVDLSFVSIMDGNLAY